MAVKLICSELLKGGIAESAGSVNSLICFFSSCCTPKFALPYFSKHCKKNLQVAQGCSRIDQTSYLLRQSIPN